jgi:hypothetical protein
MPAIFAHPLAHIIGMTLLATAILGGYALWHNKVYSNGYEAAIAHVASQNKGAKDAVRKATKNVSDCYAANGNWSVERGLCLE